MHDDPELAGLLVELHGEIGGLFVERPGPVEPAAFEPAGGDEVAEGRQVGVREEIPEIKDGRFPAFVFEELEELAVGRDEFDAGDQGRLLE